MFPTASVCGHPEQGTAKTQHAKALETLAKAHKRGPETFPLIKRFEPYCLRHTALTNLAEAGCDAFTLARIAGHGNIQMTMRYCHPQAHAIERAFARMSSSREVVAEGGHLENHLPSGRPDESVSVCGTRGFGEP